MPVAVSPIVQARHVTKWYGPRRAVTDVSFTIEPGEIVGLLGPNGSGKSTIFRILTGYLAPSAGSVEVAGYDVMADSIEVRRAISYLPEDSPLYDHMRVVEFLRFMGRIKGLCGGRLRQAVEAAAHSLDLADVMMMPTGKLSRGFRQRVSIAQAPLGDPKVLVLDEPTSGLDPHQVIAVRDLVRSLGGKHTVLLATHVLPEIEKIATRVMILLDGTLLTADALAETRHAPSFRLRIAGPRPGVVAALGKVRGVLSADVDASASANTYVVATDSRPEIAADLARAVVDQGFSLIELTDVKPDLERVFLDLTQRTVEARAA